MKVTQIEYENLHKLLDSVLENDYQVGIYQHTEDGSKVSEFHLYLTKDEYLLK